MLPQRYKINFLLTLKHYYAIIYIKVVITMLRKMIAWNNKILNWYFGMKETKLCTFIMYVLWTWLILKIFVDLTD